MLRPSREDLATRPIIDRQPGNGSKRFPLSVNVYEPAKILPNTEVATQWTPYFMAEAVPYFGGHDPLSQEKEGVMHVAQADMYDASPNPWPNNGQYDRPNGLFAVFQGRMEKPHESSAHPGFSHPTKADPTSFFHAPPIFSVQTVPVPAVGV